MRKKVVLPLATMGTLLAGVALAGPASAHGYISSPPSRQALCAAGAVPDCGQIQYEPQSVEAPKGSKLCSGGNPSFGVLDDESRNWPATTVGSKVTFNWTLTARHSTSTWVYYVDGKQVATFNDKGAIPNATVAHQVDLGAYSGDHTVLAVWNIADTANAFYNCVDLNIGGTGSGSGTGGTAPSTPAVTPSATTATPTATTATTAPAVSADPTETTAPVDPTGTGPAGTTAPGETGVPTSTAPEDTETPAEGPAWKAWTWYNRGDKVTYAGVTYTCRQSHTTLPGWEPPVVLALWLPE
jgi:predicted carbohydrate-binding protein with CBM5 and CBM33 domain